MRFWLGGMGFEPYHGRDIARNSSLFLSLWLNVGFALSVGVVVGGVAFEY